MDRLTLIEHDEKNDFMVYRSSEIENNVDEFVREVENSRLALRNVFPDIDSTWGYNLYNIFAVSAGYPFFWNLYQDLKFVVREYLQTDKPLWMQSWSNYHYPNDVLDWHVHNGWSCHGYIAITPQKTTTIFDDYEIKNHAGNIYIGSADKAHKVYIDEPFYEPRITLGYDIIDEKTFKKQREENAINISFMPI